MPAEEASSSKLARHGSSGVRSLWWQEEAPVLMLGLVCLPVGGHGGSIYKLAKDD